MVWSFDHPCLTYAVVDLLFILGLVTLLCAGLGVKAKTTVVAKTMGVAWALIVLAFSWRVGLLLEVPLRGVDAVRTVALTRCMVHTLGLPFLLTIVLVVCCATSDYLARRTSALQLSLWVGVSLLVVAVGCLFIYPALVPAFTTYGGDEFGIFP
jgi:hypothetical protein